MPYEVPIERGKVREFATASMSSNPAYQQPDAVIPPTFLTTSARFWMTDPSGIDLGFEPSRLLHGEEEYVFPGPPPRVGMTLTASHELTRRWEKAGRRGGTLRFALMTTRYTDADGTLVAEQRTTVVETERPPSAECERP